MKERDLYDKERIFTGRTNETIINKGFFYDDTIFLC